MHFSNVIIKYTWNIKLHARIQVFIPKNQKNVTKWGFALFFVNTPYNRISAFKTAIKNMIFSTAKRFLPWSSAHYQLLRQKSRRTNFSLSRLTMSTSKVFLYVIENIFYYKVYTWYPTRFISWIINHTILRSVILKKYNIWENSP